MLYISLNNLTFIKCINYDAKENKHLFLLTVIIDNQYNIGFYTKYKGYNNSDNSYFNINNRNIN